jgi:streptomycin 6-kinase
MGVPRLITLPANLGRAARGDEEFQAWAARLPGTVHGLSDRWSLRLGEPYQPGGDCSWVAPVTGERGEDLVLKVGWRHDEALQEADALRVWDGRGAVRLFAAHEEDQTLALLLERCVPGTTLREVRTEPEQDVIVAGLLHRLWQKSPADGFRPLETMCDMWADRFEQEPAGGDPGLAREAAAVFRELPRTADDRVLLHTDMHAGNILAARREPWLVIDPKPYVGDPAYDCLQHMLNCGDRLREDPEHFAERIVALLNVDPLRLNLWLFARCVIEPFWGLADLAVRLAPR